MTRNFAFILAGLTAVIVLASHGLSQSPAITTTPTTSKAETTKAVTTTKMQTASKFDATSKVEAAPQAERLLSIKVERAVVTLKDDNKVPATEIGMITALNVKEGDSLEKGASLATIDDRETLAKQQIARSELDAALATANNNAEVEVAAKAKDVSWAEWQSFLEIQEKNKGAVSLMELRKYQFQYDKAVAQEKQAINEKEIAKLTAGAKQAQLEATSVELDLRQIKAPFKCQVVEIFKKPGDWVQAGEAIMHVVGLDKVRVMGMVPAKSASSAEVLGKPVSITVHSSGDKQHTVKGIINFASPVIEGHGEHRHFRVFAEVDNEVLVDPVTRLDVWKIQPGSFATMNIDLVAPRASLPSKGSAAADAKLRTQAFKPLTGETKSGSSTSKER